MECFTHEAGIYSNLVNNPQDWFRTPKWPPFHVLEHKYGRCNVMSTRSILQYWWGRRMGMYRCERYDFLRVQFVVFVCLFAIPVIVLTATTACNNITKNKVVGQLENFLGSLSSEVLERCSLTGRGLFELLNRDFEQIFGQIVSTRVKTLSNTTLVASRDFEREKGSLPVGVRRPKTSLLITSSGATTGGSSIASRETWV